MTEKIKPEIIVFAGPNGTGKSTIKNFLQVKYEYINADDIKKTLKCTDLEAAIAATGRREKLLNDNANFAFETVLSTERNIDLLKRAKEKGYFIRSYYIITKEPSINILRIKARVEKGGHDVPNEKVINRYYKSRDNIKKLVELSDVCNIYDNSNSRIIRIFKKRKTEYFYQINDIWNKEMLSELTGVDDAIEKDLNM